MVRRRRFERSAGDAGASAVEFAIVLPLLVMLVFGIVQFSLGFTRIQGLNAAAREAGRVAALGRDVTPAIVEQRARDAAPPFIDAATELVVEICDDTAAECATFGDNWCPDADERVRVEVSLTEDAQTRYSIVVPFIGDFGGDLSATGVFRCEAARN